MAVENIALKVIFLLISVLNFAASSNFEKLIVEGKEANIEDFPHVAYLYVECWRGYSDRYGCGGSIINQDILLTAGHCLLGCRKETYVTAFVGSSVAEAGTGYLAAAFMHHEECDKLKNDIALVRTRRPIEFSKNVRRVALMKNPPRQKYARVAGWGYTSEADTRTSHYLMQTKQKVRSRLHCMDILDYYEMKEGYICGGSRKAKSYISNGDSGSALVMRKYIQVGIVAYKAKRKSIRVAMYTDIAYYYDWILETANYLGCQTFNFPSTEPNYSY